MAFDECDGRAAKASRGGNIESFPAIIRDMHCVASGRKVERKTHKKIVEHYSNISMAAVKAYIASCAERCVEVKSRKKIRMACRRR